MIRRLLLAVAFALLLALAFPFRAGSHAFDGGVLFGWLALAPLARLVSELEPRAAFRWAFFASWAGYAGTLFWLYVVVTVHGGAPAAGGVAAVLVVTAIFALHAAGAAALAAWLAPKLGAAGVFVLPAAWIVAEHLRSFDVLGGFPWSYVGYSMHLDDPMRALASVIGMYGLGFLLALGGTLFGTKRWALAFALIAIAHGLGMLQQRAIEADLEPLPAKPLRVALVQGNIPQGEKWDPELALRNLEAHVELSRQAMAGKPDLILWPEAAVPGSIEYQREYHDPVVALADELRVPLVVGGIGLTRVNDDRRFLFHNSVFVVVPERGTVERYDKTVLVPFGEYVPLRQVFGFLSAVASALADLGDITPGSGPRPLAALPGVAPLHMPVALICYEAVYPNLVRASVGQGANLLLNLTNDAWYGFSSGPDQFLAIAAMRSAEHGLPMLRAANTGISALIDATGRVLIRTPLFERKVLVTDVPPRRRSRAIYTVVGDWPIAACWAFLIVSGGYVLVRRRER
jgi:apolipoprotein N-acyltransferase